MTMPGTPGTKGNEKQGAENACYIMYFHSMRFLTVMFSRMKVDGAGACSAPVPLNQRTSSSGLQIADITWQAKKALFPLLHGDTVDAKLDVVVLLARRLSAARSDAKHPGKCERKAGK